MVKGPHPILGDGGRALVFEAGWDGIQSRLMLLPARVIEGVLLLMGSIGMLTCWLTSAEAIYASSLLTSFEAIYFILMIVYFPLTKQPQFAVPCAVLGGLILAVGMWRVYAFLKPGALLLDFYWQWLKTLGAVSLCEAVVMSGRSFCLKDEIDFAHAVIKHFEANGNRWTQGNLYPDDFKIEDFEMSRLTNQQA